MEKKTLRFEFLADTKKFLGKVGRVGKSFEALGKDMNRVGGQINKVFAGLVLLLVLLQLKQLVSFVLLRMECLKSLLCCLVSQLLPWTK